MFVSSPTSNRCLRSSISISLLLISFLASSSCPGFGFAAEHRRRRSRSGRRSAAQQTGHAASHGGIADQKKQSRRCPRFPRHPRRSTTCPSVFGTGLHSGPLAVAQSLHHLRTPRAWLRCARKIRPRSIRSSTTARCIFSMDDAVALALENNLDIGIQRYNLSIADTDILRTSSGAVALGVNAGLLQGTPGGTTGTTAAGGTGTSSTGATGGGVGGTTIGVGGAGAGAAGLVTSTQGEGPPLDSYDPVITGTVSLAHSITPESNTVFSGTNELYENTTTANFNYTQGFPTGTLLTVGFDNTRLWQNSIYNTLNPTLTPVLPFRCGSICYRVSATIPTCAICASPAITN